MIDTYRLNKEVWDKLNRCVDIDKKATNLLEYLLNVAPNTYLLVGENMTEVEPDPEYSYLSYGSIEGAEEALEELDRDDIAIVTELRFLCSKGFDATRFFLENENI